MRFKVVLEPSDEGGYTVYVPSLPGCISEGDTVKESLENIKKAIEIYLEPVDDEITFLVEESGLPIVESELTLESLLAKVTKDNLHNEVDTGDVVGGKVCT